MSYAKELSVFAEISNEVRSKRNRLALRIDTRVVLETPKDTTEAASAWNITDGTPNDNQVNMRDTSAAIAQGRAAIEKAKTFTELFIQNTKPYIERLNEGSSLQAPSKYIDSIISEEVARKDG